MRSNHSRSQITLAVLGPQRSKIWVKNLFMRQQEEEITP